MHRESIAARLQTIMKEQHLRQIDLLNLTLPLCQAYGLKMNKSDISQYLSGKAEPSADKLFILSTALNVNESWLMGWDVPRQRSRKPGALSQTDHILACTDKGIDAITLHCQKLNEDGLNKVHDYISDLLGNSRYRK